MMCQSMKPTPDMYVLQRLHGHLSNLNFFISSLNICNVLVAFSLLGTRAQILGPKYLKDFKIGCYM